MNDLRIKHLLIALAAAGPAACIGSNPAPSQTPSPDACAHVTYYKDADLDGYGDVNNFTEGCAGEIPVGYSPAFGDCDDTRADVYPGAPDLCDGIVNDCNKRTTEGGMQGDGPNACGPTGCAFAGDSPDGSHYVVCSENVTWAKAESNCAMLPGGTSHLADLDDGPEDVLVAGFYTQKFGNNPAWIYPHQDETATWQCIFDSTAGCGYTNWSTDPASTAKSECAAMHGSGAEVHWDAVDCSASSTILNPYICEIDPSATH